MTPQLSGQQFAMDSTKNVKVLPFDQNPPRVLVISHSSLECLPSDHGPNQVLTLCLVNENLTLKVIHHSNISMVHDLHSKNMHLDPLSEEPPAVTKSLWGPFQDLSSALLEHGEPNAPAQNTNDAADVSTIDLQDLLWNLPNVNDDPILMDNLCHLLNALPFDGHSVVCDPKCHTGSFDDCLDHGEERTEHCIASIVKLGYASCSYALAGIHDDFNVIPITALFAVPSDYIQLLVPAFASFGMLMLGSYDVSKHACGLHCLMLRVSKHTREWSFS